MLPHPRYDIIAQIATGDFATVYRALDKELNREVAIKQIHPHFLTDQRQLERYWQEAQLLASLEHPNIMTIYDIDRSRGWLILELMNGSLLDRSGGQPMDLEFLRVALVCSLQALKFLHDNGIVHGDVKPSNLLIDRRNWVRLGDFGLAQRAANDQGSLLKGATKYIAPERVNDQLGAVGPASDLYSLGFSIYELMCGEQFEALFPGLGAFGQDKQIAWIMWHAAPDRQAPEIGRVLEGVPDDLKYVVQRLIQKNPVERYQTADQAIYDLQSGMGLTDGPSPDELAAQAAEEEEAKKHKRRKLLYITAACSLLLTVGMLFLPSPPPKEPTETLRPAEGLIEHLPQGKIVLRDPNRTIVFKDDRGDEVYLNGVVAELSTLEEGDFLRVEVKKDDAGKSFQILLATRATTDRGTITEVRAGLSTFEMEYTASDGTTKKMTIFVPKDVKIKLNEDLEFWGEKITAANLLAGDRVWVRHDDQDKRRVAKQLSITRIVKSVGKISTINLEVTPPEMTMIKRFGEMRETAKLPFSSQCVIRVNEKESLGGRPLGPSDLRAGDEVEVEHDTFVVKVVATRIRNGAGVITGSVGSRNRLLIQLDGESEPKPFMVDARTKLKLGDETIPISEFQDGDQVDVTYDALDMGSPGALTVSATRSADRARWGLVLGVSQYRDQSLSPVKHLDADARRVHDRMVKRYRVAPDQALLLDNATRDQIGEQFTDFLGRVPTGGRLFVYVAAHAYFFGADTCYVAGSDFNRLRVAETGVPLKQLIEAIDACPAVEKVLLLDTCHAGSGTDLKQQYSSAKQVQVLQGNVRAPLPAKTIVIASCQEGQRGQASGGQGEFGRALAEALKGEADTSNDSLVDINELYTYLTASLRERTGGQQAPLLIQPRAAVAARLSDDMKDKLREMAVAMAAQKIDLDELQLLMLEAQGLAEKEPEPELLYGLGLLKAGQFAESLNALQAAWRKAPELRLPLEGMIWSLFEQRNCSSAASGIVRLISLLPKQVGDDGKVPVPIDQILYWVGQLRQYAGAAAANPVPAIELQKIDNAVAVGKFPFEGPYNRGRDSVRAQLRKIDAEIAAASPQDQILLRRSKRPKLDLYVTYDIDAAIQRVLDGMEKD
jgi:serine/threonine-protein kinase